MLSLPVLEMGRHLFRLIFSCLSSNSTICRVKGAVPTWESFLSGLAPSLSVSSADKPFLEDRTKNTPSLLSFAQTRCLPQVETAQPRAGCAHLTGCHPDPLAFWCDGSVWAVRDSSPVEMTMEVHRFSCKNVQHGFVY